ncbi:MAG: 23S rRNA (pseudouridine(1915)-N(3))-methyltransferase RlmH [Mesorhizobium sp.]|nr:23S rRNA (pseudouridine(1915)-N(3))-methyltransferase RlmH [Mesorhizobium sp.]
MRVCIHAVGRMKAGPERDLAARYLDRFAKTGPALGLEWAGVAEIPESRAQDAAGRKLEEGRKLLDAVGTGGTLVLLDETGVALGSEAFAAKLTQLQDIGSRHVWFAIGGADGHDPDLRPGAALVLSFGAMTWPHQMVRIMLAEQLYRATTILSGHPYHRA